MFGSGWRHVPFLVRDDPGATCEEYVRLPIRRRARGACLPNRDEVPCRMGSSPISLFAGAAGMDVGVHAAAFTATSAIESDPHCAAALRRNPATLGASPIEPRRCPWLALRVLVVLAICSAPFASAQRVGGASHPALAAAPGEVGRTQLDYAALEPGLRIGLAPPGPQQIETPPRGGPLRIGFHRALPLRFRGNLAARLEWTALAGGGVVGSLTVASPGALAIRATLSARLPPQGEIRFFSPREPEQAFRVTTAADFHVLPDGEVEPLWSPVVQGDAIGIEVTLPSDSARAGFALHVNKVSHRTAQVSAAVSQGAQCPGQVDVQCRAGEFPAGLEDAVVKLEFEAEDGSSGQCSATLLNNTLQDFTPYLLTANHCISTPAVARSIQATWFYQFPRCGDPTPDRRTGTTNGIAQLVATSVDQDATLLRLGRGHDVPFDLSSAGWNAAPLEHPAVVFGIHHPQGDYKKYSAGMTAGNGDVELDGRQTLNAIGVEWLVGLTEPGSSGSGLFAGEHLVGVLSSGAAECGGEDVYGNFADFYPKACPWLSPDYACTGRHIPLFPSTSNPARQGFARIINRSDWAGEVAIVAIDDTGFRSARVMLELEAKQTVHFNSHDLELGNPAKGLVRGVGTGQGDWRLELSSDLNIEALAYVRTVDGFVTTMHDVVPELATEAGYIYRVPFFNPGSNDRQVSKLRLVNPGRRAATVVIRGRDDRGFAPNAVKLSVAAGTARTVTARQLEQGDGLSRGFGDGTGKWWLTVEANRPIEVMNLLEAPTGNLANLSSIDTQSWVAESSLLPLFLPSSNALRQGFARVSNLTAQEGTVTIHAIDESGRPFGPVSLTLGPFQSAHFNSRDLEQGNAGKGLEGRAGDGTGNWALALTTTLEAASALAYVRTDDGFVTGMDDLARYQDGRHTVPIFNPGSNRDQQSSLRLINLDEGAATITITGVDDSGRQGGPVELTLGEDESRTLTAQALEVGQHRLAGRLGDGAGKWRLEVTANKRIAVMSLLLSPTGNLANLSTRTAP